MTAQRIAHRGSVLHFIGDPAECGDSACVYFEDGLLVTENEFVAAVGDARTLLAGAESATPVVLHRNALITPGFVDTHIHFPQTEVIASPATGLLEWLEKYTFPAEMRFADCDYAARAAEFFLDALLSHGTTTALVFSTVHANAARAFFEAAHRRRLRMISGKTLMDRNAPSPLLDTAESAYADSRDLIEQWHGRGRLQYAVTPRFAPTSSESQLSAAGRLLSENPGVYLHTHLSENESEVRWVRDLFPQSDGYLDVYDKFSLLGERSVFAHAIHLSDGEWRRLSESRSKIAFCPSSNLFLGSGLFDVAAVRRSGIKFGLATDIGGGTTFSMIKIMDDAYKVARLQGETLSPLELWHLATLGGARALSLDSHIGNFEVGKEADFAVLDLTATPLIAHRLQTAKTLAEKLFALAVLGGDRLVKEVYILGEKRPIWHSSALPNDGAKE